MVLWFNWDLSKVLVKDFDETLAKEELETVSRAKTNKKKSKQTPRTTQTK